MNNILFVNACVRPQSRTLELARHVLSRLEGEVTEVELDREAIPPLDRKGLEARNALLEAGAYEDPMFRFAYQLTRADTVVIAAPYWDLAFPALLKVYLEAVTVHGITFHYTPQGFPASLCRAKRLIYVTTAGGPILEPNCGFTYVSQLTRTFFGVEETLQCKAEFLDVVGADVSAILTRAKEEADGALKNNS